MSERKSRVSAGKQISSRPDRSWQVMFLAEGIWRGAGCPSDLCSDESRDGRLRVPQVADIIAEGKRLMSVCNACRYCEGYCAVFPAMERRLTFSDADMDYLANLCHNCAECYYACQYAPPHEFGVNVPKVLAEIRARSYEKNAWPRFWPVSAPWAVMAGIIVTAALAGRRATTGADFYGVISHDVMVGAFAAVFAVIILVHAAGFLRFWRDSGEKLSEAFTPAVLLNALRDGLSLKNLDSHGAGCTYPDENHSQASRRFYHLNFISFPLCTEYTIVVAFYHSCISRLA